MLKQNILLFLRNVRKNKSSFLINTVGLGIGIASFLLLTIYIYNDLTYNQFHDNLSNIYRVREGEGTQTKGLLLPKLLEEIPEIENGTRIFGWDGARLGYEDVAFWENIKYVDTGFFKMFSFPFLEGPVNGDIKDKYSVVISSELAKKYFGDAPALGKQLQLRFEDTYLTVNGVVDIPTNSSIKFDIVASYETGQSILPWIKDVHDWYNTFSETYVQVDNQANLNAIKAKLQNIVAENFLPVGENKTDLNLLPFSEYHQIEESNSTLTTILIIIALAILGIASINFINLTITGSLNRTKEIGIKKVHGATQNHLFGQILTESLLTGLASLIFASILVLLLLPSFNELIGIDLQFNLLKNTLWIKVLVCIWLVIGASSGIVPLLVWARGKLVDSIKGVVFSNPKNRIYKHASILVQFIIAIFLISGTLFIRKQVTYMLDKNPKFDSENVIVMELESWQFPDLETASVKIERISKELSASPHVASVSFTTTVPGSYQQNYNMFYAEGKGTDDAIHLRKAYVGHDYFKTMGISLLNGTDFKKDSISYQGTVILNNTAMNQLGYRKAENQVLHEGSETGNPFKVVGVVDDFSYQGVQNKAQPLAHFFIERENFTDWDYIMVRSKPKSTIEVIELLKEKWTASFSGTEPNYYFASSKLNEHYKEYTRVNFLIAWFSVLAISLSCIGLFALSSYTLSKKTKEIGIRKVNGAKISEIWLMLNKDFLKWVVLALVISIPISWYAMQKWLQGFAHKTVISWWVFVLAGLVTLFISLMTIGWQSWRAATQNPTKSLRTE